MKRKASLMGLVILLSTFNHPQGQAKTNLSVADNTSNTVEERLGKIATALQMKTEQFQKLSESTPNQSENTKLTSPLQILLAQVILWRNGSNWNDGRNFGNWRNNRNRWRDSSPFINFRNF